MAANIPKFNLNQQKRWNTHAILSYAPPAAGGMRVSDAPDSYSLRQRAGRWGHVRVTNPHEPGRAVSGSAESRRVRAAKQTHAAQTLPDFTCTIALNGSYER